MVGSAGVRGGVGTSLTGRHGSWHGGRLRPMELPTLLFILGALVPGAAGAGFWRLRRRWSRVAAVLMWFVAAVLLGAGGFSVWYHHRPAPTPVADQPLFEGITWSRWVLRSPRPIVVNQIAVDLDAPGVRFMVTPPDPRGGRMLGGQTTAAFLERHGCQVAVNGGPFSPWYSHGLLSYYPHVGDPVDPAGLTVSEGREYAPTAARLPVLRIDRENRISIGEPIDGVWSAISGLHVILRGGVITDEALDAYPKLEPRTACAIDATGRRLLLFTVDGRQPGYSEGMTLKELAGLVIEKGGHEAINLDGGGSTSLAAAGPDGRARILNCPCHGRIPPGIQRPVATHLGVFARPLGATPRAGGG